MIPSSFIFWSTLLIYQFNSRSTLRQLRQFSTTSFKTPPRFLLVITFLLLLHLPFLSITTVVCAGALGLLSILYNLPEQPLSSGLLPLRGIPLLKVLIIAFVWASISTLLPLAVAPTPSYSSDVVFLFAAHFLFILGITLPFDLRDFANDKRLSIMTVPHIIGVGNTKLLAFLCISGFTVMMCFQISGIYILPLFLATTILIFNVTPERNKFYFSFWLDGTILLYFLIIHLFFEFSA